MVDEEDREAFASNRTDEELLAGVSGLDDVQKQTPVAFESTSHSPNIRGSSQLFSMGCP